MQCNHAVVLALALAFAGPGAAVAENWIPFYVVTAGVAYVDKDSVIQRGSHVSARLQSQFPKPQSLQRNGRVYVFARTTDTVDVDCEAAVYRFVARDLYTQDGLKLLSLADADDIGRILPGSVQEALGKAFCAKGYRPWQ